MYSVLRGIIQGLGKRGVALLIVGALFALAGCDRVKTASSEMSFGTEYQAVFLDNGQVFFGKISEASAEYPMLNDVFYVQTQTNPETKEVRSVLIKRGHEWHGPAFMRLNARHIVVIEPVAPESKVAQLIREANTKR